MALLFLNRATLPIREPGPGPDAPVAPPIAALEVSQVEERRPETGGGAAPRPSWDLVVVEDRTLSVTQTLQALAAAGVVPSDLRAEARAAVEAVHPADRVALVPLLLTVAAQEDARARRWAEVSLCEIVGVADLPGATRAWELTQRLHAVGTAGALDLLPEVRVALEDPRSVHLVQRTALQTAARTGAVELLDAILPHLGHEDPAQRRFAWTQVQALVGAARPFDPDARPSARTRQLIAWHTWWEAEGPALVEAESLRRDVLLLGRPLQAPEASQRLLARRAEAWPLLVGALDDPALRGAALLLLRQMTGLDLPPDPGAWRHRSPTANPQAAPPAPPVRPAPPSPSRTEAPEPEVDLVDLLGGVPF
jgi:hypothetical protein